MNDPLPPLPEPEAEPPLPSVLAPTIKLKSKPEELHAAAKSDERQNAEPKNFKRLFMEDSLPNQPVNKPGMAPRES